MDIFWLVTVLTILLSPGHGHILIGYSTYYIVIMFCSSFLSELLRSNQTKVETDHLVIINSDFGGETGRQHSAVRRLENPSSGNITKKREDGSSTPPLFGQLWSIFAVSQKLNLCVPYNKINTFVQFFNGVPNPHCSIIFTIWILD